MRQRSILIVEDNPITRKVVRLALGFAGYLVLEAGDAAEAQRIVAQTPPDLILQDLMLPDMDGFELVARLRTSANTVGIPIIAFSGFLSRLEHGRAAAAGFDDFLPKPVDTSRLVHLVQSYLPPEVERQSIGNRRSLLLVDNDPVQLKLARILLQNLGFTVLTARDGAEALETLRLEHVDSVLSNVFMPRIDGFRLCAEIHADPKLRHIPVVLLSSNYVEESDRQLALNMGASDVTVRTADFGAAIRAVEAALEQPARNPSLNLPPLRDEQYQRVLLQLERQAARNATYVQRFAMHASMLSVLAGVSEALIQSQNLDDALPSVLASLLDASGVSQGAIYFYQQESGALLLGGALGYDDDAQARLRQFCGQPQVFEQAAALRSPVLLTSACLDPPVLALLEGVHARCALLVPLVSEQECLGLLLLASRSRDLTESDWIPFARTIAVQIGQALALSRAFSRLKASENLYRRLVENAGDGIFTLDADRRVEDVNPAMERILGHTREGLIGRSVLDLVAPEDLALANASYGELLKGNQVRVIGRRLLRADGQIATCDISASVMEVHGLPMTIGIARDVTEKNRVEGQVRMLASLTLAASEAPDLGSALEIVLRMICEATGWCFGAAWLPGDTTLECAGWWTLDPAIKDQFEPLASARFSRGEGILGKVWQHTEHRWAHNLSDLSQKRQGLALQLGLRGGLAVPVVDHDTVVAVLEFFYFTAADDNERVVALVTTAAAQLASIISRQRAHNELRVSEARFTCLTEAGIIGIGVTTTAGQMLEANDAYLKMLGFSRQELHSGAVDWSKLTPPEWAHTDQAAGDQLAATGVAQPWEKELFRKDGTRLPVTVAATMFDNTRCLVIVSDISQRRNAELALTRSQEQLRQSQKMEAVGRLAGGVAHDFNNLLSIILSYSQMSIEELGPNDPMREDLSEVLKAGNRAAELTRQLLLFSRQQVLDPKVLDLNGVLAEMDKMLQRLVGADVEMVSLPTANLGHVRVDPGSIEQVVMNLVVNARDAMPTGGKLTLETANVYLDEEYACAHLGSKAGPHVMLAVSDSGAGMDRETQAHIFEPFFTTKEPGCGTGLGLSTVFGIVQASGGSVQVYSETGLGTVFKIYLPQVDAAAESPTESSTSNAQGGTETVLLVEDEDQVRAVAANILRKYGYNVLEASGPGQALLLSEQTKQRIDLLLSDVVMPQMSGPELATRLVALRPEMKVLHMSGYTDDTIFRHGVMEARVAYLQKPITPDSLTRKVREVLDADT